ncbi:hypothetical protein BKA63DRAFT_286174 [Paraphoma chrysanthemicola]|nr:hypothetical protein BKA63DRAFT_286174 [Paraphoma chrysanthemicola]
MERTKVSASYRIKYSSNLAVSYPERGRMCLWVHSDITCGRYLVRGKSSTRCVLEARQHRRRRSTAPARSAETTSRMSTSNIPPTLAALRASKTPVFSSTDMLRIHWTPFGSMQSTIQVAEDLDAGPNSTTSPYQLTAKENLSFHQISTSPATEPPVSSITMTVSDLEDWAWRWEDNHGDCGEGYDEEHQEWTEEDEASDESNEEEEKRPRKLIRCCDEDRPQAPAPLIVRPSTQEYITVHDFITQTHRYVENLRADILAATEEALGTSRESPRYMSLLSLDTIHVRDGSQGRVDRHWKGVAEHVKLRRDGKMIA